MHGGRIRFVGDEMSINRHTIVAGSLAFILLAGLSSILYDDSSHLSELLKERLIEKETMFDELRKMQNGPVEKLVKDYSYWDDLASFVESPTDKWALDNLDSSFAAYNYQYLWIYRKDGVLIRSVQKNGDAGRQGDPFPLPVKRIESLLVGGNNVVQFYMVTPRGVMNVFAAPIRSTKGTRNGKSYGFLLAGVLLDETYFLELSRLSRSTIKLLDPAMAPFEAVTDPNKGLIVFLRDLSGIDGQTLKKLTVRMDVPDIRHVARQKGRNALTGTGLIAVLYILAGYMLMSRQRLKMANQNLHAAQQAARMGSWQRNVASGICSWSDNLFNIFGLPKSGATASLETFYNLVHPEDLPRVRSVIEQAFAVQDGYDVEFRLIRPDGEIRTMRSRGSMMLAEGVRKLIVGYTQDITELARITHELAALNSHKDGLIAMLDHDLRTPLTPLTILLPLIRRRVGDHESRRLVDICRASTASMTKLADKARMLVTFFTSVNAGELESVTLVSLVEQSLVEGADCLTQQNVACQHEIDPELVVRVIPRQIKELLLNLLSNAVRFSAEGGTIRITAEQHSGKVTVAVHDDGVGLEAVHLEPIFAEFFKVDESRHDLEASGLGLAICKRIVCNHQGRIWAESPGLGQGTTIKFTL